MPMPSQKTLATVVAGVIIAVTPSFLSYLQARQEIQSKYEQSNSEADAGYKALVVSVADLQKSATTEHDYVVRLEGQITTLTTLVSHLRGLRLRDGAGLSSGSAAHENATLTALPLPKTELPPMRPDFEPPPVDLTAAQTAPR